MGVQGKDFKADLLGPNSKPSKGLRKANLSPRTKALLEEIALSEQVLMSASETSQCHMQASLSYVCVRFLSSVQTYQSRHPCPLAQSHWKLTSTMV